MTPQPADSGNQHDTKIWSCINCRRRKVRCDRRHPCLACTRNKVECVFPASGRITKRPDRSYKNHTEKQAELLGRLRRLESLVADLGSQVENTSTAEGNDQSSDSLASFSRSPQDAESGSLEMTGDGDLIIRDRFWTVFCQEVEQIFETVHGPDAHKRFEQENHNPTTVTPPDARDRRGYYAFLLRNTSAQQREEDLNPLPSQIPFLWQTYVENVDPFLKILHVPTMAKIMRELRGRYDSLSPSVHALVVAICFAAVMSIDDVEVRMSFHTGKVQLMAQYRLGVEDALSQADFINRPDLVTLQALAIYLSVLQYTGEMKAAWLLAGVLIRVGLSMKLHLDSLPSMKMPPFMAEARRKLWWQICLIDSRSQLSQISGFKMSEHTFTTQLPTNTSDNNLQENMPKLPPATEGWTDQTPFLIRCFIWKFSRRIQSSIPDVSKSAQVFCRSQLEIETTYLNHVDPSNHLHTFVAAMTRLFLAKIHLTLYFKQTSIAKATDIIHSPPIEGIFPSLISIIENTHALQTNSKWAPYQWQLQQGHPHQQHILPWQAIHLVLNHLLYHNNTTTTATAHHQRHFQDVEAEALHERAWLAVKNSLEVVRAASTAKASDDDDNDANSRDPRYEQLTRLMNALEKMKKMKEKESAGAITATADRPSLTPLTSSAVQLSAMPSLSMSNEPVTTTATTASPQAHPDDNRYSGGAGVLTGLDTLGLNMDIDMSMSMGMGMDMNMDLDMEWLGRGDDDFSTDWDWNWNWNWDFGL